MANAINSGAIPVEGRGHGRMTPVAAHAVSWVGMPLNRPME